jgi:hypothetical protein
MLLPPTNAPVGVRDVEKAQGLAGGRDQHAPVAAEAGRAVLAEGRITIDRNVIASSPWSGAHEDASWRFSVFSRRKLLRQIPRLDFQRSSARISPSREGESMRGKK